MGKEKRYSITDSGKWRKDCVIRNSPTSVYIFGETAQ